MGVAGGGPAPAPVTTSTWAAFSGANGNSCDPLIGRRLRFLPRTKSPRTTGPKVSVNSVTPFLWFNHEAEEAAKFYASLIRGSKITHVTRIPSADGSGPGTAMVVEFELAGQPLVALNGGPTYRLTPAFSLSVSCRGQREVDFLWTQLSRGGQKSQCGWLVDRFGLSWQIVPVRLMELLSDPDPGRAQRAMGAMMKMTKIDVAKLELAANSG